LLDDKSLEFGSADEKKSEFYLELVYMLAALGESDNEFVETLCKKIFSVEMLLARLSTPGVLKDHPKHFNAYLRFLHNVHTSTFTVTPLVHSTELAADERIWMVLRLVQEQLQQELLRPSFRKIVHRTLLPFIQDFFEDDYRSSKTRSTEHSRTQALCQSVAPDIMACLVAVLKKSLKNEEIVGAVTKCIYALISAADFPEKGKTLDDISAIVKSLENLSDTPEPGNNRSKHGRKRSGWPAKSADAIESTAASPLNKTWSQATAETVFGGESSQSREESRLNRLFRVCLFFYYFKQ
jgi:hypothetical protein